MHQLLRTRVVAEHLEGLGLLPAVGDVTRIELDRAFPGRMRLVESVQAPQHVRARRMQMRASRDTFLGELELLERALELACDAIVIIRPGQVRFGQIRLQRDGALDGAERRIDPTLNAVLRRPVDERVRDG